MTRTKAIAAIIAAAALAGLAVFLARQSAIDTLVARNQSEFRRISGLRVESWT